MYNCNNKNLFYLYVDITVKLKTSFGECITNEPIITKLDLKVHITYFSIKKKFFSPSSEIMLCELMHYEDVSFEAIFHEK